MSAAVHRILLGPQSPQPNVDVALAVAGLPPGPLAVISAGWQEAEGELDELAAHVNRPLEDLALYRRLEDVLAADPEFAGATRNRQDKLKEQQRLYRLRLRQLSVAARHTLAAEGDAEMVAAEQRHAIAQLRALDRHHLHRCEAVWRAFDQEHGPGSHRLLARHAGEVAEIIARCGGVLLTGGNVAILINRLRLLGVDRQLAGCNVVAWSAGAMALARRIVLYHDRSPEGRRDPEVLGAGCGVVPGHVFLPDARKRLRRGDRNRIGLFCRRFAPDVCMALDNGAELHLVDGRVQRAENVRRLGRNGRLIGVRPA